MSWQEDSRNLLRTVCGDVGPTYEYNDTRLNDLILYSAKIVLTETFLSDTYTIALQNGTITPDPVGDNWFISLLVLKAWEVLANNEYRVASNKALSIKDGPSSVDGRGVAEHKKEIAKKASTEYSTASVAYNAQKYSKGKAVLSPFRVYDNDDRSSFFN